MINKQTKAVGLTFLIILFYSCAPKEKILSLDEYQNFGQTIINDLKSLKHDRVSDLYNQAETFDKILTLYKSFDNSPDEGKLRLIRAQLNKHFRDYIKALFTNADSAKYEISKTYIENDRPHIVIAFKNSLGYNFFDFELKTIDNKTYIVDCYNYIVGENFSDLFINNDLSRIARLHFGRPGYNQAINELTNAQGFIKRQEYNRAWTAFNRIDEEYQWGKTFQLTKLAITRQLSDSLYEESYIDFINTYYDQDKFRIMKTFQFYYEFQDLENAKITLDSLSAIIGDNFVIKELRQQLQ